MGVSLMLLDFRFPPNSAGSRVAGNVS